MSSTKEQSAKLGKILRSGLAAAKDEGVKAVQLSHLKPEEADDLVAETLAFLRSRPGKPSHLEGWQKLSVVAAGVLPWWSEAASLTPTERRKVAPLRDEVYAVLEQRHLVERDPEGGASVHVSPAGTEESRALEEPAEDVDVAVIDGDLSAVDQPPEPEDAPWFDPERVGAWVLKASPYVYDLALVFGDPSRTVREWAVETGERSAAMQAGQPVYFWVLEGDPYRQAGVWGAGRVVAPCTPGAAVGLGWLDPEAAGRAKLFAQVEITLYDIPVASQAFLADARLVEAEVIREPLSGNPSYLTPTETAALTEYVGDVPA